LATRQVIKYVMFCSNTKENKLHLISRTKHMHIYTQIIANKTNCGALALGCRLVLPTYRVPAMVISLHLATEQSLAYSGDIWRTA